MTRNRKILAIVLAFIILIVLLALIARQKTYPAYINAQVAPSSSKITFDGKSHGPGIIGVNPGTYEITATHAGFTSQTQKVVAINKKTVYVGFGLIPDSSSTSNWYTTHPADQKILEAVSGKNFDTQGQQAVQTNPLIKQLPYIGPGFEFRVDYGSGPGSTSSNPTIYITGETTQAQHDGLIWITSQGYNTSTMNIQYVTGQP